MDLMVAQSHLMTFLRQKISHVICSPGGIMKKSNVAAGNQQFDLRYYKFACGWLGKSLSLMSLTASIESELISILIRGDIHRFRHIQSSANVKHKPSNPLACIHTVRAFNPGTTPNPFGTDNFEKFSNIRQLFDEIPDLNVVSATSVIGSYSKQQKHEEALYLFSRMLFLNIRPSEFTFGTVIHSSIALRELNVGKQLHACAVKMGLNSNVFVGSAVLDCYAKLGSIEEATRVFRGTRDPNVVSYTTMICGLMKNERFEDAIKLFEKMPDRNVVTWNAVIGGYSQKGYNEEAVNLFIKMLREGLVPNQSTFPCAITAASNIAALGVGKTFHACAMKFLGKLDIYVANSLISFYAKCGSMEDSLLVFDKLCERNRNTISWNAVICGYAQNGKGKEAIHFYERMRVMGIKPNDVTLLGLLWACNHAGLVDKGYSYFNQARLEDPKMLKPEHYACIVDLLSRSGRFKEAESFVSDLPFDPGVGFWKALLGGCQIHSNTESGELAAKKILELDPNDVSSYVMLSNAHSVAGRWDSVSTIRREMKEKRMKRIPGCSWIEIRSTVHVFVTGDRNHQLKDEIYGLLRSCVGQIRENEALDYLIDD